LKEKKKKKGTALREKEENKNPRVRDKKLALDEVSDILKEKRKNQMKSKIE